jgi:cysteine sulfinate desulfinase/cysteine desulfurase-like protein
VTPQPVCYLDNNATIHVAPEVFEAMQTYLTERWGNVATVSQDETRL